MPNEVELIVTATDATKPTQDRIKAGYQTFANSFQPLGIKAANPINDAFMAQVRASVKELSNQSLEIPVEPDTATFREQLEEQVQYIAGLTKADIPLEVGNAAEFRAGVMEQIEELQEQARIVVSVSTDTSSLNQAKQAILANADATDALAKAQQDVDAAMAKGDPAEIAKANQALVAAQKDAAASGDRQASALLAVSAAEKAAGESAAGASAGMRALNAAMGPLWMVMNVAQIAMMGLYTTSNSTSTATQDLSQQLIALGKNGSNAASSLSGNSGLANLNTDFTRIGSSAAAFSQAFSGSIQMAKGYVDSLTASQTALGNQVVKVSQELVSGTSGGKASGESMNATYQATTQTIAQLAQQVNNHTIAEGQLSPAIQANIDKYNAYNDIIGQAKKAYNDEQAALAVVTADLQQQGITLSTAQQGWNAIGGAVSNTVSEFNTATAGVKSLADATVAAASANLTAQAQFQQLDQTVATTATSLTAAERGIVTAEQAVGSALQGVQNAQYGATTAEQSYVNALGQEQRAQQAVADARKQAQQNLIDLQLQANDAAAGSLNAGVSLFDATNAAALLGVNAANEHAIASEQVTAQNEAQVKAAIALIVAQNQLADSQNGAAQAQGSLATAQSQGIDGATGVVSANQALLSSLQQVAAAQHGEQTAQEALAAAATALANAQYGVGTAQDSARTAAAAHKQALDAASTSTDINSAAGNRNWTMLENLFEKNLAATGSVDQATAATEAEGEKMGFTAGQIDGVINEVTKIPPVTNFSIVGTPSLNLATLLQQASAQGISPYSLGLPAGEVDLARGPIGSSYAQGGAIGGAGGPTADDQLIWASTGEHMWTADEVQAAGGHQAVQALRRAVKGYAGGGGITPQQAMGINLRLAGWDGFLQATSFGLDSLGASLPDLPRDTGTVDFGSFGVPLLSGAGATAGVTGSRAQNEAIVQSVFASMFGWTGPEWAATVQLLMQESGFNNVAQNPTSTAYGMFQFLNSTWAGYGIPKTSDPTQQSIAGGRYIKARYNDPIGAEAHERAFHWFAGGGPANDWTGIGDAGAEAVRLPNGSTVIPAANTAALAAAPAAPTEVSMTFGGNVHTGFATLIMNLIRTNQIQLNVNGQRVKAG